MFDDIKRTRVEAIRLQELSSEARIVGRVLCDIMNSHFDLAFRQLDQAMRALRDSRRLTRTPATDDDV